MIRGMNHGAAHDGATLSVLQATAAREAGVPERFAGRLAGDTIAALRSDAQALAAELGVARSPERGESGRVQTPSMAMSRAIRRAAGYE